LNFWVFIVAPVAVGASFLWVITRVKLPVAKILLGVVGGTIVTGSGVYYREAMNPSRPYPFLLPVIWESLLIVAYLVAASWIEIEKTRLSPAGRRAATWISAGILLLVLGSIILSLGVCGGLILNQRVNRHAQNHIGGMVVV
jgi:hypothetical protein